MFTDMINNLIIYCNTIVYLVFTIWGAKYAKVCLHYLKIIYWHKASNVSVPGLYY